MAKVSTVAKRVVFGRALASERMGETLLPKRIALPVFASDAMSSVAYASEEILLVLAMGGVALLTNSIYAALAVALVMVVVVMSYRQNVNEYQSGGGDYEIASVNLGPKAGITVASALLVDYILLVAVSISAAVDNLTSSVTSLHDYKVELAVGLIVLLALINLRGVKESGTFLAFPTYAFLIGIFSMFVWAFFRIARGDTVLAESASWQIVPEGEFTGLVLAFLLLRAFTSGCAALTGIEAISNGVPAFRPPKGKNAATTLLLLGGIGVTMFVGITLLAQITQVRITHNDAYLIGKPENVEQKTVIAQIANAVFSDFPILAAFIALVTALILVLAANTGFNGFPLLGSILARDGFLPRQLQTRGDRLAHSNGIIALAAMAVLLVIVFSAEVTRLIPLYAVGVFTSFTLSQYGMMRHWNKRIANETIARELNEMKRKRAINTVGFTMTGIVLVIIMLTKFTYGAWISVAAMAAIYLVMRLINRHYQNVSRELAVEEDESVTLPARVHAIVLVSKIHKPTLRAIAYARATRPSTLEAVTVAVDAEETEKFEQEWNRRKIPVTLTVLHSPYREITRPILDYVRSIARQSNRDLITIYIPEYVVGKWWEQLLHNQSALRLKGRLLFTPGVMVVSVPWQLASSELVDLDENDLAPGLKWRG